MLTTGCVQAGMPFAQQQPAQLAVIAHSCRQLSPWDSASAVTLCISVTQCVLFVCLCVCLMQAAAWC